MQIKKEDITYLELDSSGMAEALLTCRTRFRLAKHSTTTSTSSGTASTQQISASYDTSLTSLMHFDYNGYTPKTGTNLYFSPYCDPRNFPLLNKEAKHPPNPPKDPRLATAITNGMSQVQIHKLKKRGKL